MLCSVEPAAAKPRFFPNPTRPGYEKQTNFLMPKPADTDRIFLVGESAAKGYPPPPHPSSMRAMLSEAAHDQRERPADRDMVSAPNNFS